MSEILLDASLLDGYFEECRHRHRRYTESQGGLPMVVMMAPPGRFVLLCSVLCTGSFFAELSLVRTIDVYGLRTLSEATVRQVLGFTEGDPQPSAAARAEIVTRLEEIPGVRQARLHGGENLLVGIQEEGSQVFRLNLPPGSDDELPGELVSDYREFLRAAEEAISRGEGEDDFSQGHSLMADPESRTFQEGFITWAARHEEKLRGVLHQSADPEQRAIAAAVIAYAPAKARILKDLERAVRDPDPGVRNNAARAIGAIAWLASNQPDLEIQISLDWIIEMLNSAVATDRNKASFVLFSLTKSRDPELLEQLRQRALPALIEMSRWRIRGWAFFAYASLGRIAGLSDQEIAETFQTGEIERVLTHVSASQ